MTTRAALVLVGLLAAPSPAAAQPTGRPINNPAEAEFLVPPQGGAYEVPLHAGEVCILSFPERMAAKALSSSTSYEIKSWGDDGVAVRALTSKAEPATVALATMSGNVKVNVTLTIVPPDRPSLTLVRFKAVSAEEAFEAQVAAAVARRLAPLEAELARFNRDFDAQLRDRAEAAIAERLLKRNESIRLSAHERNDQHVIIHVRRAHLIGDEGYLIFEIENRSRSPYRVATIRLLDGTRDLVTLARLAATPSRDAGILGTVLAGTTARALVVIRSADGVLGKPLALEVSGPERRGTIRVERGISLR